MEENSAEEGGKGGVEGVGAGRRAINQSSSLSVGF